jgi:hypothetical protein
MHEHAEADGRRALRRFTLECALFLALQAAVFAALQAPYTRLHYRDHYFDAWIDKHARLASLPPPRLILAGGSSWAFGVQSPRLERALGRPVVNLGLHAGLGREFMLREAEAAVRAGDVVVLSLEYPLLAPDDAPDVAILLDLVTRAPRAARFVAPRQVARLLDQALGYVAKRPRALALDAWHGVPRGDEVYARSAFNAHGDVVAHHGRGTRFALLRHGGLPVQPDALGPTIARLNEFARRVEAAGARAFLSLPPIPIDDRNRQRERLAAMSRRFRAELELPVLEPEVPGYTRDLFFDTAYHLTRRGARRRTLALIDALKPALAAPPVY